MGKQHVQRYIAQRIRNNFKNRCAKCGRKKTLELHHVKPLYTGGSDSDSNLIPLCHECHRFAPDEFRSFILFLSSPYCPTMDTMRTMCLIMCKYFRELNEEELQEFRRSSDGEEYFKTKLEPMFAGLRALIYGFDEAEDEQVEFFPKSIGEFKDGKFSTEVDVPKGD